MTVGCLAAALWGIDLHEVRTSFARANYITLPVMVLIVAVFFWLKAIRWRYLLAPVRDFRTKQLVPPMMIGFMGNNILPAHLGELMRIYVLSRQQTVPKTTVFTTVLLERVFDVLTILLLFGAAIVMAPGLPETYRSRSLLLAVVAGLAVLILAAYVLWTDHFVRFADAMLSRLPGASPAVREKIAELLHSSAAGLHAIRSPRLAAGIVATSLLQWAINGISIAVALWSFGIEVSPLASFVVLGIVAFGVTVPSTPGFFGVIQLCFWFGLQLFGVDKADAFAASVYYHLTQYIPVTLTGLFFASRLGMNLGEIERAAGAVETDSPASASVPDDKV